MAGTTALQLDVPGSTQLVHVGEQDVHRVATDDLRQHETFDIVIRLVDTRYPHERVLFA